MYSKQTIKRTVDALKKWIAYYDTIPVEDLTVSISDANRKVPCPNVSKAPVITCPNCNKCMHECYDIRDCYSHGYDGDVVKARAKNTSIFKRSRNKYFFDIAIYLLKHRPEYFRVHVGGDMVDRDELERWYKIAEAFPGTKFWTYSKTWWVYDGARPANFGVMLSPWEGMTVNNPGGLPEFRVVRPGDTAPAGAWTCPGACAVCIAAGRGCPVGETTYAKLH